MLELFFFSIFVRFFFRSVFLFQTKTKHCWFKKTFLLDLCVRCVPMVLRLFYFFCLILFITYLNHRVWSYLSLRLVLLYNVCNTILNIIIFLCDFNTFNHHRWVHFPCAMSFVSKISFPFKSRIWKTFQVFFSKLMCFFVLYQIWCFYLSGIRFFCSKNIWFWTFVLKVFLFLKMYQWWSILKRFFTMCDLLELDFTRVWVHLNNKTYSIAKICCWVLEEKYRFARRIIE